MDEEPEELPDEFIIQIPRRDLGVDEYRQKAALGELGESSPEELLEGNIVRKESQSLRHEASLEAFQQLFKVMLPEGTHARIQQPLDLGESKPEPDVAVVRNTLDNYATRHPVATEVSLIVEVADASLAKDRRLKARIYARAGILTYWLLNVMDRQLEIFTNPSGPVQMPGYHEHRTYRVEDRISLVIGLSDLGTIRIGDLIP
jgi:Uma2 family endonuclease